MANTSQSLGQLGEEIWTLHCRTHALLAAVLYTDDSIVAMRDAIAGVLVMTRAVGDMLQEFIKLRKQAGIEETEFERETALAYVKVRSTLRLLLEDIEDPDGDVSRDALLDLAEMAICDISPCKPNLAVLEEATQEAPAAAPEDSREGVSAFDSAAYDFSSRMEAFFDLAKQEFDLHRSTDFDNMELIVAGVRESWQKFSREVCRKMDDQGEAQQ